jgi:asparagine synthase (glutamine-hydrolysing)
VGKEAALHRSNKRPDRIRERVEGDCAVAGDSLTIDRRSLAHYFRYQYVPTTESIFSEVKKLAPGSSVEIDLRTHAQTTEVFSQAAAESLDGSVALPEEVLEEVRRSVRRRLVADVPVGAFLSGGTDSSLVVACMKEAEADCRTFSIGFDDPRFDESAYALAVAKHLGTNHTHRVLRQEEALELMHVLPDVYDEPFADSSALPQLALARLAREQVTVALSGDGGDEMFGGYLRYRAGPYLAVVARLPSAIRTVAPIASRVPVVGRQLSILAGLAAGSSPGTIYRELISVWKTPELERLIPGVDTADGFADGFDAMPGGPVERMMRTDARTYLMDDILQKVDRATMAASLEARNPLLDPAVGEIGLRSAAAAEANPGRKPLLRATLRLVLPEHLVERPKMGFGVPVGDWVKSELRPLFDDLVLGSDGNHYDAQFARRVGLDHLSGRRDAAPQVWSLLVFELWRERWHSRQRTGASEAA